LRERIRVVVIDGHTLLRQAMRDALDSEPDIRVVGDSGSCEDALVMLSATRPDVMLLDIEMIAEQPSLVLRRLGENSPATRVLILSMADPTPVLAGLEVAVPAYRTRTIGRQELATAVRDALTPAKPAAPVIEAVQPAEDTHSELSGREREVLSLVSEAMSNRQIAAHLSITEGTVKRHLSNIFKKLKAVSRIDAVNKGFLSGLATGGGMVITVEQDQSRSPVR
jgi:two-component system nitrate/nitrite response regulator NarL